jgi:hypothetical protein
MECVLMMLMMQNYFGNQIDVDGLEGALIVHR